MTLVLEAKDGCCEEAALGVPFYAPCNEPATKVVGWTGRSDKPIRMCDACADHNVKNRGGYIVSRYPVVDFSTPEGKALFDREVQRRIDLGIPRDKAEMLVAVLLWDGGLFKEDVR